MYEAHIFLVFSCNQEYGPHYLSFPWPGLPFLMVHDVPHSKVKDMGTSYGPWKWILFVWTGHHSPGHLFFFKPRNCGPVLDKEKGNKEIFVPDSSIINAVPHRREEKKLSLAQHMIED